VLYLCWVHRDVTEHLAEGEQHHQRVIGRPMIIGMPLEHGPQSTLLAVAPRRSAGPRR
jgi:hypothetical protein